MASPREILGGKMPTAKAKAKEKARGTKEVSGGAIQIHMEVVLAGKGAEGSGLPRAAGATVMTGGLSLACDPPLHCLIVTV
jgi:hypothetical protein